MGWNGLFPEVLPSLIDVEVLLAELIYAVLSGGL